MAKRKTIEPPADQQPVAAAPLRLEWRSPAELAENPRNWRRHPESQLRALAGAVSEVGWAGACLYNERTGRLIDGHARRKVAQEQGCELLPVLVGSWDEAQEAKILATLDPLAGMAEADPVALDQLLRDVDTGCADLQQMLADLWDEAQADAIADTEPAEPKDADPQTDRAAELQVKWGTAAGQLWLLGKHRLLIGDCRNPEDMARLCGADKINVAFTSPPYASQRKYDESSGFKPIPPDEYVAWWEPIQANVRKHLANDGSFFVNIKPHCEDGERVLYVFDLVLRMRRGWGWQFVDEFCWRNSGTPKAVDRRFKNQFEPVYHFATEHDFKFNPEAVKVPTDREFVGDGRSMAPQQGVGECVNAVVEPHEGMAYPGNVLSVNFDKANGHAAAFPIGLPSFFIRAFSDPGDVILDPFMGSGTTCIAAENHGRQSRGCEISAKYAGVILQRYADAFPAQEIRLAE